MELKIFLGTFLTLFSISRSNLAAEGSDRASTFGKIFEDYVLELPPSTSLYTNGFFECALTCRKAASCNYFNYQSSLEISGICELYQKYLSDEDIQSLLLPKPGFLFVQMLIPKHSCLEFLRLGANKSGIYQIIDQTSDRGSYKVYCDFTTEPGTAWTLVSSRRSNKLFTIPFFTNFAIDEEQPNWINYRLSLGRMEALQTLSTHWRITCNLPTDGFDYRDYVRAKFSAVDLVHLNAFSSCKQVEYINIRGYNCSSCVVPWWQNPSVIFHTDSSLFSSCSGAMTIPGSLNSEDNFGYYDIKNAAFRCTHDSESTTNWWFGGYA